MALGFDCLLDYFSVIAKFHKEDEATLIFLWEHGVLPTSVKCSNCAPIILDLGSQI